MSGCYSENDDDAVMVVLKAVSMDGLGVVGRSASVLADRGRQEGN